MVNLYNLHNINTANSHPTPEKVGRYFKNNIKSIYGLLKGNIECELYEKWLVVNQTLEIVWWSNPDNTEQILKLTEQILKLSGAQNPDNTEPILKLSGDQIPDSTELLLKLSGDQNPDNTEQVLKLSGAQNPDNTDQFLKLSCEDEPDNPDKLFWIVRWLWIW